MKPAQVLGLALLLSGGAYMVMRISQSGINKIKAHEALRLRPYKDEAGHWTIGYGHKLLPGEWYDQITEDQAEQLLRKDLSVAERAVNQLVKVPLTSSQYDALVSFVYNVGAGAFGKSTLLQKLNEGDYTGAAQELDRWVYAGGKRSAVLAKRRSREKSLFLAA